MSEEIKRAAISDDPVEPTTQSCRGSDPESMLRMKQDDWLEACKEIDSLRSQLTACQADAGRMRGALEQSQEALKWSHILPCHKTSCSVRTRMANDSTCKPHREMLKAYEMNKEALSTTTSGREWELVMNVVKTFSAYRKAMMSTDHYEREYNDFCDACEALEKARGGE